MNGFILQDKCGCYKEATLGQLDQGTTFKQRVRPSMVGTRDIYVCAGDRTEYCGQEPGAGVGAPDYTEVGFEFLGIFSLNSSSALFLPFDTSHYF
jgi:hypothetical protein